MKIMLKTTNTGTQIEFIVTTKKGNKYTFYIDCLQPVKSTILVLWKNITVDMGRDEFGQTLAIKDKSRLAIMSVNSHGYIVGKKEKTYNTPKNAISASVKEFLKTTKIKVKRLTKITLSLKVKKELKKILQEQLLECTVEW